MTQDFKVKDINQADFGRKEISIAESEMPGLMSLRDEYRGKQPLKDINPGISVSAIEISFLPKSA